MDTLTHALSGALLARATERRAPKPGQLPRRTRMWVGFWAAAFPDSDFVLRFIDPLTYLTAHRGATHSILLLPLWAAGLALAFALIARGRYSWRAFVWVCALGIGAHIAGDVITAFGTMVFTPISDARVAWPTTFIIDPYFTGIIVLGLLAAAYWSRSRVPALFATASLAAYVGFQGLLHERAVTVGQAYARAHALRPETVQALPQPFSPFNWMIVIEEKSDYFLTHVNLIRHTSPDPPAADASWLQRVRASYFPVDDARWQRIPRYGSGEHAQLAASVWQMPSLTPYRHFVLLPAVYRVDSAPALCIWFEDLRFALAGRDMPFRYGACRENGTWQLKPMTRGGAAER